MATDFSYIFTWWFVLFVIGFMFLPLTSRIFSRFADRGYPFAKILGILLVTYTFFILGQTKLIFLTRQTLMILTAGVAVLTLLGIKIRSLSTKDSLISSISLNWKFFLFEELIFFFALTFWSYVRGFAPEIRGLEKFMDFGFMNSILTGKTLPPLDMWLTKAPDYAGHFINYYYFGHLYSAILTSLSGIDSTITYNLLLATLFAFTVIGSFSISVNLLYFLFYRNRTLTKKGQLPHKKKLILAGLLGAFLVALAGNLHTIYVFTKGYPNESPIPFWKIMDGYNPLSYWYPNATRFISHTIHEFPIYSFVVSDLHGHVLDIPFVLLTLAFLLALITKTRTKKNTIAQDSDIKSQRSSSKFKNFKALQRSFKSHSLSLEIIFLGLLLGAMYMTNAWDGLIYLILTGLVLLYVNAKTKPSEAFKRTFFQGIFIVLFFIIFTLPFSLNFRPFVSGIGVVCPPQFLSEKTIGPFLFEKAATHCDRSPHWMMAILWGFFAYSALGFIGFIIYPHIKIKPFIRRFLEHTTIFCSIPFAGNSIHKWLHEENNKTKITDLNEKDPIPLFPTDILVFFMIILSAILIIFPEFFYAKDIYPLHYRANTMFKLGYEAFIMMQLASTYIFFRILLRPLARKKEQQNKVSMQNHPRASFAPLLWTIGFFAGFFLVAIYPYFAINSYYGGLKTYKGLDGLTWMKVQYPDDYKAVLWLRKQIGKNSLQPTTNHSQPTTILEAVGESYTDYSRISANTGLPTVVGWPVHEWLWRGSYDEPGKRIPLVKKMYTSTDVNEVKQLLDKYNVSYIFVGTMEREKYPTLTEKVFQQLGDIVFDSGDTRIYQIRKLDN